MAAARARFETARMLEKILVLARGAASNQPAVERALRCASPRTELVILDVVHEPMLDGYLGNTAIYEPLRARVVAERRAAIEALAADIAARGVKAVGKAVWEYPLDEAVASHAREEHADLVVIAPPIESGGLAPSDWRLVTRCPAPVLVVRGAGLTQYRRVVAAVDPFHVHAKPAELDRSILAAARELERQAGATLAVVHCYMHPEYFGAESKVLRGHDATAERREALDRLVEEAGLPKSAARLVTGAPTDTLLKRMAQSGEADLIVMGALARGRLGELFIGSTAERVLHGVTADVLAIKAPPAI
jgi:universal stress protein E